MKCMLLIYGAEDAWAALPPEKMEEEMAAYFAFTRALEAAGAYIDGSELQPAATARSVAIKGADHRVLDGPYVDTKEQLGGYYLIEVPSIEAALDWAARCPGARYGGIEVRPIVER